MVDMNDYDQGGVTPVDLTGLSALQNARSALPPDPLDALHGAQEAILDPYYNDLMSRGADMTERLRAMLSANQAAGANARSELEAMRGRIRRGNPWLAFAGEVMQPNPGGAMPSIGRAITALNTGLNQNAQQDMGIDQALANFDSRNAQQDFGNELGVEKMGMGVTDTAAKLRMAQQRLRLVSQTPAERAFNWVNSAPDEATRKAREEYVTRFTGTAAMKNASAIAGGGDQGELVARLQTLPQYSSFLKQALKMFPEDAFMEAPAGLRQRLINQAVLRMAQNSGAFSSAATGRQAALPNAAAQQAPVSASAGTDDGGTASQNGELLPSQSPVATPAEPSPADKVAKPWLDYLGQAPTSKPASAPGVIPDKAELAARTTAAREGERQAQDYFSKSIQPAAESAQATIGDAETAESLLKQHPNLTGAGAPYLQSVSNWLNFLGYGVPDFVKKYAGDATKFNSLVMNEVLTKQLPQKGPQTESDARRMMEAGLKVTDPIEKNFFVVRAMKATAQRAQDEAQFFSAWQQRNNGSLRGAREAWDKYTQEHPLVRPLKGGKMAFWNEERDFRLQQLKDQQDQGQ